MGEWTWQVPYAVVGGLVLFALVLVPVLLVQYRRYGRPSGARVATICAISVYAVALAAYTLLPIPDAATCARHIAPALQLVPFRFVRDIVDGTRGLGLLDTLSSRAVLQVVLNVVLFVPFGVLVRRFWRRSVVVTTVLGLAASLLVEATQATALWGLAPCAYRIADVDDVLTNTLGALLGALLAPALLGWLPKPADLARTRLRPERVGAVRRWVGMVVDVVAFVVVVALVRGTALLLGQPNVVLPELVAGLLTFLAPSLRGTGASLGQRLVWLRPTSTGPATLGRRLLRAAVPGGLCSALLAVGSLGGAWTLAALLALVLAALAVLSVPFTRGRRGLSGVLVGGNLVDARR